MSVGDILNGAFASIRQNPAATLGLATIVMTIYTVLLNFSALLIRHYEGIVTLPPRGSQLSSTQTQNLVNHGLAVAGPQAGAEAALAILANLILTGLLTVVIGRAALGRQISMGEAWRAGWPRLLAIVGTWLLSALLAVSPWVVAIIVVIAVASAGLGGAGVAIAVLVFIAAVIVSAIIAIRVSLATVAVVLEKASPTMGIRRSWRLVKGTFWRVFGILLLGWLITEGSSIALSLVFSNLAKAAGGAGSFFGLFGASTPAGLFIVAVGVIVTGAIVYPVTAGISVGLYLDLRMRKEGLDLALQAATQNEQLADADLATVWRPPGPS